MMRRANTPITGEPFVAGKPTTSLVTQGHSATHATQDTSEQRWFYAGIASLADALWAVFSCR